MLWLAERQRRKRAKLPKVLNFLNPLSALTVMDRELLETFHKSSLNIDKPQKPILGCTNRHTQALLSLMSSTDDFFFPSSIFSFKNTHIRWSTYKHTHIKLVMEAEDGCREENFSPLVPYFKKRLNFQVPSHALHTLHTQHDSLSLTFFFLLFKTHSHTHSTCMRFYQRKEAGRIATRKTRAAENDIKKIKMNILNINFNVRLSLSFTHFFLFFSTRMCVT